MLVPNPSPAEWRPFHRECRHKLQVAEHVLPRPRPRVQDAADGAVRALAPTEVPILAALAGPPGALLRGSELATAAWSGGAIVHDATLDDDIPRLRRKLRALAAPHAFQTARGVGSLLR